MMRDVASYVTSACHAQSGNPISSLDGVVFPAGLTLLVLVSFGIASICFVVCGCDV